jgi:hypothetical protein
LNMKNVMCSQCQCSYSCILDGIGY